MWFDFTSRCAFSDHILWSAGLFNSYTSCWQFTVNLDYQRSAVTMVTDCRWLSQGLLSTVLLDERNKKLSLHSRCECGLGLKNTFLTFMEILCYGQAMAIKYFSLLWGVIFECPIPLLQGCDTPGRVFMQLHVRDFAHTKVTFAFSIELRGEIKQLHLLTSAWTTSVFLWVMKAVATQTTENEYLRSGAYSSCQRT